jgi:hypothetical protein
MKKHLTKKRMILLAVVALAIGLGTTAFAYFTSTGNGTGSATVGTSSAFTVTPTDVSASNKLYPGGPAYAVDGTVSNDGNAAPQFLARIDAAIQAPTGVASGTTPNCTAADFALTSSAGWVIDTATTAHLIVNVELATSGGGASYAWSGLDLGMVNRSDTAAGDGLGNQDRCKDASAKVKFTAS